MAFKDILLHLDSYPDATPFEVVDKAVRLCAMLGRRVTATAFQTRITVPGNPLAERLLNLRKLAEEEEARSLDSVWTLLARFATEAEKAGLEHHNLPLECDYLDRPARLAELARGYDLCVVPYFDEIALQTVPAEAAVFESGRPVLIFRGDGDPLPSAFKRVLVAWDGGRAASRAVADAMPLLQAAQEVRVLTILGEKPVRIGHHADQLRRHLSTHGIDAEAEEYTAAGRRAGEILEQVATERGFDLLVMGAYGHSRIREFILGGATQHLITSPPLPILLSH